MGVDPDISNFVKVAHMIPLCSQDWELPVATNKGQQTLKRPNSKYLGFAGHMIQSKLFISATVVQNQSYIRNKQVSVVVFQENIIYNSMRWCRAQATAF